MVTVCCAAMQPARSLATGHSVGITSNTGKPNGYSGARVPNKSGKETFIADVIPQMLLMLLLL